MSRYNASGRPLSGEAWLAAHHRAKLRERSAFARRLAALSPTRIIDLGCATGLWLELLNDLVHPACSFVGVDSDSDAVSVARERAAGWSRRREFVVGDIEFDDFDMEPGDLVLAFNVFPYVVDPRRFLDRLVRLTTADGAVAVRQYDGSLLRMGPMESGTRVLIDASLRSSVEPSDQFKHYDLDRVLAAVRGSAFERVELEFELFERFMPFPDDFLEYFEGTLDWMESLVSDTAREELKRWRSQQAEAGAGYFVEVDLVALLSS